MTLMTQIDTLVVVARLGTVRYPMLKELRRILDASSVSALGVVITDVEATHGYGPYHQYGAALPAVQERAVQSALHAVEDMQHRPSTS